MILHTLLLSILLLQSTIVHPLSITPTTQSHNNIIRGSNKYGTSNNSTILTPSDAAHKVGVLPTKEATKEEWQRAWKLHRRLMKPLHLLDGCRPKDSKLALACLWWKAIAGNDKSSPVHDYSLSYDLLPPVTRWIVSCRVCRLYPRLHHANVEIRTAYLDKALTNVINTIMEEHNTATSTTTTTTMQEQKKKKKIRLVIMGGGYDTRSIKLLEQSLLIQSGDDDAATTTSSTRYNRLQKKHNRSQRRRRWYHRLLQRSNNNDDPTTTTIGSPLFFNITSTNYNLEAYELDLPEVVTAKRKLLSQRLFRRRPWLLQHTKRRVAKKLGGGKEGQEEDQGCDDDYPILMEANFNDLNATRKVLEGILLNDNKDVVSESSSHDDDDVVNIILFEGVMIYLDEGIPHALLELCSRVLRKSSQQQQQQQQQLDDDDDTANNNNNSTSINSSTTTRTGGYLCFADRLENIPGGDIDAAHVEMESTGWELVDFLSKPGLARHMGVARVVVE